MNTNPLSGTVDTWGETLRSGTIAGLHVLIVLAVVAVTAYATLHDKNPKAAKPDEAGTPAVAPGRIAVS